MSATHSSDPEWVHFDNSGAKPLSAPGVGLPIHVHLKERFQHGINDFHADRVTVREITMLAFMDLITDKPDWDKKVFDKSIIEKWQAESKTQPLISSKSFEWCIAELRDKAKTFHQFRYVKTLENQSTCVKSDVIITPDLMAKLINHRRPLQDAREKDWYPKSNDQVLNLVHPSWFPLVYGQSRVLRNGQVGLKSCLESCGQGEVAKADQVIAEDNLGLDGTPSYRSYNITWANFWSKKFQWLPCEVRFTGETETGVKISSYINNLHSVKYEGLYSVIEQFISSSIPMWNEVLLKTDEENQVTRIVTNKATFEPWWPAWASALPWRSDKENGPTEEQVQLVHQFLDLPDQPGYMGDPDEEEGDDIAQELEKEKGTIEWAKAYGLSGAMEWKHKRVRQLKHPEPGEYDLWKNGKDQDGKESQDIEAKEGVLKWFEPNVSAEEGVELEGDVQSAENVDDAELEEYVEPEEKIEAKKEIGHVTLQECFSELGLQVIVKLAGTELTPEKPNHEGGSWHLEGMLNEHIVATSIYYYDAENVTDSQFRFRQNAALDEWDLKYEQDDHEPLQQIFGTESIRDEPAIQEFGRIATNEGRLLVYPNTLQHQVESFELKDGTKPGHRRFLLLWLVDPHCRITSTSNVPPQRHDWWADEVLRKVVDASKLPPELSKMVEDETTDYPMSMEEAKKLRLELMEERTNFGEAVERIVEEYNLCEH